MKIDQPRLSHLKTRKKKAEESETESKGHVEPHSKTEYGKLRREKEKGKLFERKCNKGHLHSQEVLQTLGEGLI